MIERKVAEEFCSLVLWSARRLPPINATYVLNDFLNVLQENTLRYDLVLEKYYDEAEKMLNELKK